MREDLSLLKDELTIGINASTLLEKDFGFVQNYYCISDLRFLNHPKKRSLGTTELSDSTVRVLRKDLRDYDEAALRDRTHYVDHLERDGFSENLRVGFFYGCTTTMLAIQLAYYLGCSEVYLLGVDLRYGVESPRFYPEGKAQLEDSFTSVQIWNIANASRVLKQRGRRLYNCSEHSLIRPYLEYLSFADAISK